MAGLRGDFVGNLAAGAGDLTGEQRRSSNCCCVTRLGLLLGNRLLLAPVFTGVLEVDLTGVLEEGLEGDWNKFEAALDGFETDDVFEATLGELRMSSNLVFVICLGDLEEENKDLVGAGFKDCRDGVLGFVATLDFSGLKS